MMKERIGLWLGVGALLLMTAGSAQADVISLLGDKDCFGLPGVTSCPDGSLWRDFDHVPRGDNRGVNRDFSPRQSR